MPEHNQSISATLRLIERSIENTAPFVYSRVEKMHGRFILFLENNQPEDLGSLGVAINGTTIMEIYCWVATVVLVVLR